MKITIVSILVLSSVFAGPLMACHPGVSFYEFSYGPAITNSMPIRIVIETGKGDNLSNTDLKELVRLAEIYRSARFANSHRGILIEVLGGKQIPTHQLNGIIPENLIFNDKHENENTSENQIIQAYDKNRQLIFKAQSFNELFKLINQQLSRI